MGSKEWDGSLPHGSTMNHSHVKVTTAVHLTQNTPPWAGRTGGPEEGQSTSLQDRGHKEGQSTPL